MEEATPTRRTAETLIERYVSAQHPSFSLIDAYAHLCDSGVPGEVAIRAVERWWDRRGRDFEPMVCADARDGWEGDDGE